MSCWRAAALMRTIQSRRKSRFLFLRSRYAYFQPRSTFSLAAFHSLERAPKAPLACLRICFFRLRRGTFDTARGIVGSYYAAWMRRLIRFCSPFVAISPARRRFRFRFEDFLVRMWLLNALKRFTLPEPVVLKRFVAPLCVFIFGIARSLYLGVRIIVMDFPSSRPALSIFATSANSLLTRSSTACPSSG